MDEAVSKDVSKLSALAAQMHHTTRASNSKARLAMAESEAAEEDGLSEVNYHSLLQPRPPRYMEPTFVSSCSTAPTNYSEGDRVKNSFSSGACWGIRKLPPFIKPGTINDMRKRETATNLSSVPLAAIRPVMAPQLAKEQGQDPATVKSLRSLTKSIFGNETSSLAKRPGMIGTGTGAGMERIAFGKIPEYMGTVYGREQEVDRNKESEQKMLAESFSRPAFATDASGFKHLAVGFVPPDFGPGFKPEWDCLKRKDEDHTFLFGPFSKCVPSRELLPLKSNAKRWCRQLYDLLAKDWPNLHFALRIAKDELLVQFPTQKQQVLPAMGAVQRYMAHLIAHGDAMKMGLQKRGDRWGVLEAENNAQFSAPATTGTTALMIDSGTTTATPDSTDSPNQRELDLPPPTTENDGKGPGGERYLTFSFYFPWVTIGRLTVHKKEARRERKNTRDIKYARSDESLLLDEMVNQTMAAEKELKWQVRIEKGKRISSVIEPMYNRDALSAT